ncbi:MAG: hypothetical protein Q9201_000465 [Fulgogasparrea decipioides]
MPEARRQSQAKSVIEILSDRAEKDEQHVKLRREVIEKALELIDSVHNASCTTDNSLGQSQPSTNQRTQKMVDALIDLVVIEGIYPSLAPGVGVPMERRVKSALKGDLVTKPLSQDRSGQLEDEELLVTILTSLLHPSCPDWFRSVISSRLSTLPLRPDGVRQTINFVAEGSAPDASISSERGNQSAGPNISLDALARASKLLTSVPSGMTPDTYLAALAPQLLDLLDDPAADNRRIAAYIIGNGILSKRKLGSPGTAGWALFAEPILESLNPPVEKCPVSEKNLKQAIDRLSALVHFHANPGLTKRLVAPILLPLWGLLCYAFENRRVHWAEQSHQIMSTYMKISVTDSQLLHLSDNLLWKGTTLWTFMPGTSGGIELRQREPGNIKVIDMNETVKSVDSRVETYSNLLRSAVLTDDQLCKVFTHVSKRWLLGSPSTSNNARLDIWDDNPRDPLKSLVAAKLTQKLLEDYKVTIASSFEGILQLVEPVLTAFVNEHERSAQRLARVSKPSLLGLGDIIYKTSEGQGDEESGETVSAALSLLSAVLTSSSGIANDVDTSLLDRVQKSLDSIAKAQSSLDRSLSMTAANVLMLLDLHSVSRHSSAGSQLTKDEDVRADERNRHRTALQHLSDEMAPVRAQGLSTLTDLISQASSILNIPSTIILLISLLQDEDEYIYLAAIRALGILAYKHPRTVVKMLVEQYIDIHEDSTLDVRIKIGEALNKTIQRLGQAFIGEAATTVGESMIAVASRRGDRSKTVSKRERAKWKAEKARRDAEEAWDGEMPEVDDRKDDEEGKMNEEISKVVEGWADTGREEDIRIRTSALSILGTAIETTVAGLGATITSTAIDCVIAILKLETSAERAILRRAAVMVIMSTVKALDAADERGQQLGFGFAGENLAEVITVLKYVEVADTDEVVVGHVRAVIESLEAWQQKSVTGLPRSRAVPESTLSLHVDKIAGLPSRPKIQEID